MVNQGLLGCSGSFASAFCIAKLIECVASFAMLVAVAVVLVRRLRKQRRFSFYIIVSVTMILTLTFIIAFSLDAAVKIFNFLYLYFYNTYFSIIAYKLATKVLQKFKQSLYYRYYRYALIIVFIVYGIIVIGVLVYRIIDARYACEELAFVVASSFNLTVAIIFLVLGINHIKWQQQKMDQNLPQHEQNNPLPRIRLWIALNCIGQVMVLVQAVIFQVNGCAFSSNEVTNEIVNLIFVFICFHTGMISTLYFFMHEAPDIKVKGMVRKISNASSTNANQRVQIELVYHESEQIRAKMVSF